MTYLTQSTYSGNTPRRCPQVSAPSQPIRAELHGSDTCTAEGITARGQAPTLTLCRLLVDAGVNPHRPLHAYRGDTLCLTVRSIGNGALLRIRGNGVGFEIAPEEPRPAALPVRFPEKAGQSLAAGAAP